MEPSVLYITVKFLQWHILIQLETPTKPRVVCLIT